MLFAKTHRPVQRVVNPLEKRMVKITKNPHVLAKNWPFGGFRGRQPRDNLDVLTLRRPKNGQTSLKLANWGGLQDHQPREHPYALALIVSRALNMSGSFSPLNVPRTYLTWSVLSNTTSYERSSSTSSSYSNKATASMLSCRIHRPLARSHCCSDASTCVFPSTLNPKPQTLQKHLRKGRRMPSSHQVSTGNLGALRGTLGFLGELSGFLV